MTLATELSQPDLESISPPNDSIARAISGADIVSVPFVSSVPVMLAVPAKASGSTSEPFRTTSCAAKSGRPGRSATMTRNPFSNLVSLGVANFTSRGAEGVGVESTPPMARAVLIVVRQKITERTAGMTNDE